MGYREANLKLPWCIRVRHARERTGYSQAAFAKRMNMSEQTVYQWEKMHERPYSRNAERFERLEAMIEECELATGPEVLDWDAVLAGGDDV